MVLTWNKCRLLPLVCKKSGKKVVVKTEIHFQRRKVRFTDEPESGNQINMSYCEEHAGEVWSPFIWPVGPAAVGGMYHHMARRGRTTAGEARPKEMGGKGTLHFITWKTKHISIFFPAWHNAALWSVLAFLIQKGAKCRRSFKLKLYCQYAD